MKRIILSLLVCFSMPAFSQDGSYDETFIINSGADYPVFDIHQLPGGKILVAGQLTDYSGYTVGRITRLNANGDLDTAFFADVPAPIFKIVVEDDGKIVTAGESGLHRLNADGSADTSFTPPALGSGFGPNWVVKQGEKYIVAGDFTTFHPDGFFYENLVRLNADGTIDVTFAQTDFGNTFNYAEVLVQEDGKLLVTGGFASYNGTIVPNIMRLDADGELDTTFTAAADNTIRAAVMLADGKYLIAGYFTSINGADTHLMARLNNDGSVDDAFTYTPGAGLAEDGVIGSEIIVQPDNKILVSGWFHDANVDIEGTPDGSIPTYMVKLNANGTQDTSFTTGFDGMMVFCMDLQEDGKILAGGWFTNIDGVERNNIARLGNTVLSSGSITRASFAVYPNPVQDQLFISADTSAVVKITLLDVLGKEVYSTEQTLSGTAAIDMSRLGAGIYFLKVAVNGQTLVKKVIKN